MPHVAVLMCTYNGSEFITAQLTSLAAQQGVQVSLWVSDDGSDASFLALLDSECRRLGLDLRRVFAGPRQGFAANFLSLLLREEICADYYACADQDDIWLPDKLQRAVQTLQAAAHGEDCRQLYCSRTTIVDAQGRALHLSPLRLRAPTFENALIESLAGGNTMVLNHAARQLVQQAGLQVVVAHDWWLYQLISGCGGQVLYDPQPSLLYRQHAGNLIGSKRGWLARVLRLRLLLQGRLASWNTINTAALQKVSPLLTQRSRHILQAFIAARRKRGLAALMAVIRTGVWRHSRIEQIIFYCASLIRKI